MFCENLAGPNAGHIHIVLKF